MEGKDLENGQHVEKDYAQSPVTPYADGGNGASLQQTPTNYTITNEQFERLYLSPRNQPVKGELRKTFANPTVLGVAGFAVGLTPLSAQLMGWRGMLVWISAPSILDADCNRCWWWFGRCSSNCRCHDLVRWHVLGHRWTP